MIKKGRKLIAKTFHLTKHDIIVPLNMMKNMWTLYIKHNFHERWMHFCANCDSLGVFGRRIEQWTLKFHQRSVKDDSKRCVFKIRASYLNCNFFTFLKNGNFKLLCNIFKLLLSLTMLRNSLDATINLRLVCSDFGQKKFERIARKIKDWEDFGSLTKLKLL